MTALSNLAQTGDGVHRPNGVGLGRRMADRYQRRLASRPGGRDAMTTPPLWLDRETMRRLGYRTIDALVDRLSRPWDASPIVRTLAPEELAGRIGEPAPEAPHDLGSLLERLERDVLPFMARNEHPGYFAYIPGCGTWPGALRDLSASGLNMAVGPWGLSAGRRQVEPGPIDGCKQWCR